MFCFRFAAFGLLKAVFGVIAGSSSLISDAVNNITDSSSSLITIVGTRLAGREPTKSHPFGFGRIEYLTSMIIGILVAVTGFETFMSGVEILIETISKILGEKADDELSGAIYKLINDTARIGSPHDLIINNYGPEMHTASVNVGFYAVDSKDPVVKRLTDCLVKITSENKDIAGFHGVYADHAGEYQVNL